MKKVLTIITLSLLPVVASAQQEASPQGVIDRLVSYASNSGAYVSLSQNGSTCSHGYHVEGDSGGYNSNLSMLIAAYHTGTPVVLRGDTTTFWSGSSSPVCRLTSVQYIR